VNKKGFLANGYPGGRAQHKKMLEADGITVDDNYKVDVDKLLWHPELR
jgi:alkylated DNA nucleotide flippase Atl1